MAETIENNLRSVIIEQSLANPAYYEKMSTLLKELIQLRKEATVEYEEYLKQIIALAGQVQKPESTNAYPTTVNTEAKRAFYDNIGKNEVLTNELDHKIRTTKKDGWRSNPQKTKAVRYAIEEVLEQHEVQEPSVDFVLDLVIKHENEY